MKRKKISDICDVVGGFAFPSNSMKCDKGRYQIIKMSNLYQGNFDLNRNPSFIDEIEPRHKQYLLQEGDVLMTLTGTIGKKDYGFSVQILKQKNLLLNQRVCLVRPKAEKVNGYYLLQLLRSKNFLAQFFESSIGGTGNQSNVSITLLKDMVVELPEIETQTAIADMLLTWDQSIEKTERLITVKEKQFTWLINKLITKEERTRKWRTEKLEKLALIQKGEQLNVADMIETGKYYALNGGIEQSGFTNNWNTHENTITISEGGNSCGFVNFNIQKFWCGGHCYALNNVNNVVQAKYLYYYLKLHERLLMSLRVGSGLPNIQKKDLKNISVIFPSLIDQKKIAEILDKAQQEIDLLKKQLEAYRKQKRGLMQKLLTGQWRVKIKEGNI